jgi:hypothetical protein
MLILEADISFSKENLSHELSTKNTLRPAINFGNNLLFSGTIIPEKDVEVIVRGRVYKVTIEMPTVGKEAYEQIIDLVNVGNVFKIQQASKMLGNGTIQNFVFEDTDY